MAANLTIDELERQLRDPDAVRGASFDIAKALSHYVADPHNEKRAHDLVLRALEHRQAFGSAAAILDGLLRQVGLFPYLEAEELTLADSIAYEFHRPLNMAEEQIVFHRVQAEVYNRLLEGENVILSAPTSFGKSLIIDAIIASGKYNDIAVIVPTIALIDETRRRLSRFSGEFKLITHGSQQRGERNLLIMTQERILDYPDIEPLDFFVIDEFYKLKPRAEDTDRSYLLNEAFYRLRKTGAQFYLLGPNIKGVDASLAQQRGVFFLVTDYKTVVSEVRRERPARGQEQNRLVRLCREIQEPTLIYCSSPNRVRTICEALLLGGVGQDTPELDEAAEWISNEYSPDWLFPRALRQGIGMHHGRLPRTLAQFVVRSFNEGRLRFLVCTSTLIEGVNTKAKNVIIYDNAIARRKFDFFTYNNIVGRSGRMFQHFIGRVFIFHEPPAEELPFVDVPILTQPEGLPDSLLVQIEEEDLTPMSKDKLSRISEGGNVEIEVIRQNRGIDPKAQQNLARELSARARYYWPLLNWSHFPTRDQLYAVCELIWKYLVADNRRKAGVSSGRQLAFTVDRFRKLRSVPDLLKAELHDRSKEPTDDVVDGVMDWLRLWANFWFPRHLMAVDRIQRSVFQKQGLRPGDFSFFAGQIENWFVDPALMALDEYGVPIQTATRIAQWLQPSGDLDAVLERLRRLNIEELPLSRFERSLLADAQEHL
jgi:hypothetical protein